MFKRKKVSTVEVNESIVKNDTEYNLYVVMEKNIPGIVEYFRGCSLNITSVFNTISDARNKMLMDLNPKVIVIVEAGMGVFTATKVRQDIIDMLSLSDEYNKVIVFYTNSILRTDAKKVIKNSNNNIVWNKYVSIVTTVANIMSDNNRYIINNDSSFNKTENNIEDILNYKGNNSTEYVDSRETYIGIHDIVSKTIDTGESIPMYTPHI